MKEVEFRSDLWQKFTDYRKKIARIIIKNDCLIGKTKKDVETLFGKEDNYYELDEWSYRINKTLFGGEKFLLLDFEGEYVKDQKLYTVYNLGNEIILSH